MTKVTLHYDLDPARWPTRISTTSPKCTAPTDGARQVAPSLDKITVDYDASRLMKTDVEAVLVRHGVPIRTEAQAVVKLCV